MRLTCLLAAAFLGLASLSAFADPALPLTPQQNEAVEKLIHDYLMNHPEVLVEAVRHADEVQQAQAADAAGKLVALHKDELERDPTSPVLGNPNGDVTMVEFFDYRCPYCKAIAPTVRALLESDHKLRLVLKEYPVLGADSAYAARVSLVAGRHDKYQAFHEAMFALKEKPTPAAVLAVAKSIGLDPDMVKKEMESPQIDAILKHDMELGQTLSLDGTPTFIIGTKVFPGAVEIDELRERIEAVRKGET